MTCVHQLNLVFVFEYQLNEKAILPKHRTTFKHNICNFHAAKETKRLIVSSTISENQLSLSIPSAESSKDTF